MDVSPYDWGLHHRHSMLLQGRKRKVVATAAQEWRRNGAVSAPYAVRQCRCPSALQPVLRVQQGLQPWTAREAHWLRTTVYSRLRSYSAAVDRQYHSAALHTYLVGRTACSALLSPHHLHRVSSITHCGRPNWPKWTDECDAMQCSHRAGKAGMKSKQ